MKKLKTIYKALLILLIVNACTEDERSLDFLDNIAAPSNVAASYNVTQDNTGLVTITPTAEGAVSFDVTFGDDTTEPESIEAGKSVQHTYAEGVYQVTIVAHNTKGDSTTATQELVVSFQAPQNLLAVIENDAAISRQVNITATAEFATTFEFYSGETDVDQPVATANIGETINYQYAAAGTYAVKVIAKGAAIETTEYAVDFEVTSILQPLSAAPVPINSQSDVISIYSDSYTTGPSTIDYYPNWGQSTLYNEIEIGGNKMIQYSNINYQGIDFATNPIDASSMEFIHIDVWSAQDLEAKISPISSGPNETAYDLELTRDEWTSFDIPISFFTDANPSLDFSDLIQFKLEGFPSGEGTIFIDNLYLYKVPTGIQTGIVGTWKLSSTAGSLGVGPSIGDITWWNCDADCVAERACYYDDLYIFNEDGSFTNELGSDTWVEEWQGGLGCSTPVAPHDGSNAATYVYDENANTVTLNGVGAFIGLAKANNSGELASPADAPSSITYNLTFTDPNTISVSIEAGAGVFWQFQLERAGVVTSPLTGNWKLSTEAGSLGVGPSVGDVTWWNCDDACVAERACYYDDVYSFGADGSFTNILGADTWIEEWQGGLGCAAPVAPHDGSNPATYSYAAGQLTLNGVGAFIGLPKAVNSGELASPADAPDSVVYDVSFIDNNTISVSIESGSGVFWQYKLVRI